MISMERSKKPLVITRALSFVILIAVIGIVVSPFTTFYTPIYPTYTIFDSEERFTLDEYNPTLEFNYLLADKVIIKELTTNGSAINIGVYPLHFSGAPYALIENVTEIRDNFLVIAKHRFSSELEFCPNFLLSRYDNHSARVHLVIQVWSRHYQDYIVAGPSYFLILIIPLLYVALKRRGQRPTSRGYMIILVIVFSALFMSPAIVYSYNHGYETVRQTEVVPFQNYTLTLDTLNPVQEFNLTIEASSTEYFTRVADLTTNNESVSLIITREGGERALALSNITVGISGIFQFEFPNNVTSTYTVRFMRIDQNTTISLSLQSVHIYNTYWIEPTPFLLSAAFGLTLYVISLVIPRDSKTGTPLDYENNGILI